MKKILVALICFSLMSSNFVFAELIKDDLAEQLDKNLRINKFSKTLIEDDFAQKTINPKLRVQKIESQKVNDEFVLNSLNQNSKIKKQTTSLLKDNKVETTRKIVDRNKYKNVANNDFSYGKIKVQPKQYYTTRTNLQEGKYIDFVLAEDIKIKNTLYKIFMKRFSKLLSRRAFSPLYPLPLDLLGVCNTEVVGYTDLSVLHSLARLNTEQIVRLTRFCIFCSTPLQVRESLGVYLHILRVLLRKLLECANLLAILPPLYCRPIIRRVVPHLDLHITIARDSRRVGLHLVAAVLANNLVPPLKILAIDLNDHIAIRCTISIKFLI